MPEHQDAEHLRLLSICHYVVASILALFSCFPIFHLLMGISLLAAPEKWSKGNPPPPPEFGIIVGVMFTAIPLVMILLGWAVAFCVALGGHFLSQRKNYTFCFVIAVVQAAFCMPLGTILGIFTIIVLIRPSVKQMFAQTAAEAVSDMPEAKP